MTVPPAILDRIAEGKAVLFLGAGASYGAQSKDGKKKSLNGRDLGVALADKFLGGKRKDSPLAKIADFAATDAGEAAVQLYIRDLFEPIYPAAFHKKIAKFRWRAIITTNYDLLIERAYEEAGRLQDPVPVIKNNDLRRALDVPNSIPIIKLHGCISQGADVAVPMVISNEHYHRHTQGRERLSTTFQELAKDYPIVFCGYDIGDPHVQAILFGLEDGAIGRPSYLAVNPSFDDFDTRRWAKHNVVIISATFERFLAHLDREIPETTRRLGLLFTEESGRLAKWIQVGKSPSRGLQALLARQLTHVAPGMPTENASPDRFYRGESRTWAPIFASLDFERSVVSALVASLTAGGASHEARPKFILLTGHAGSGKSVAIRRAALTLASEPFGKFVVFAEGTLDGVKDYLVEMAEVTDERLHLFVDNVLYSQESLEEILRFARQRSLDVTVVGAARNNEWNVYKTASGLEPDEEYSLGSLGPREARELCELLDKYHCLGELAQLTRDEQVERLMGPHERHLLVALHEATSGKELKDIVLDEYSNIAPPDAQVLYLDICSLHRLGVPVRAGLIARLTGIRFEEFKNRFLEPLDRVVSVQSDWQSRDFVYKARHRDIAQIVFDQVLATPDLRANQIARVVSGLNAEYASDDFAASKLIRGRRLADEFADRQLVDRIFAAASQAGLDISFVRQQEALFELSHPGGSAHRALRLIDEAIGAHSKGHPGALQHTKAVVLRDLSRDPQIDASIRERYRGQALEILRSHGGLRLPYTAATVCEILKDQLSERLKRSRASANDRLVDDASVRKVEELERSLAEAQQRFPEDVHLSNLRAQLHQLLENDPRAIEILQKAFKKNVANEMTCLRLARQFFESERTGDGLEVLRRGCVANPGSKALNFELARALSKSEEESRATEIEQLYRRSFTDGDTHFEAQFWYARHVYLFGDRSKAKRIYQNFRQRPTPYVDIARKKGAVCKSGELATFVGTIRAIRGDFGFVAADALGDEVFLHNNQFEGRWDRLRPGDRVSFGLAFSFRGPVCVDARKS